MRSTRGGASGSMPAHLSATDPRAALLIAAAQGHPLTPAQHAALAEARGQMSVQTARQQLQPLQKMPGNLDWLGSLLGVTQVKDFVNHPSVGSGLEALASLPLPWTKALKGGELMAVLAEHEAPALAKVAVGLGRAEHASAADILRKTPQPVIQSLHHGHTAFNVASGGAALTNAIANPNKSSALAALGYVLPEPPAERAMLSHLAKAAQLTASADAAVQNGSLGAGINAYGASPLRAAEDARAVERFAGSVDRAKDIHDAAVPEGEGNNAPIAQLLQRLLAMRASTPVAPASPYAAPRFGG